MKADMTDRELLEQAALAAELDLVWSKDDRPGYYGPQLHAEWTAWNPLEYDADALRLAVALRLDVSIWDSGATVTYEKVGAFDTATVHEHGEPLAATRRAITRAAAKMGEAT